ncbi:MAG TPA: hypothetical protein H9675_00135 [Firmicutes bacterium]|nr:hypothetical protein [Bacillota bacterium]
MKYLSLNSIKDFEFHDAEMKLVSYNFKKIIINVKHLNIHKEAEQNNMPNDMEIDVAQITFNDFFVRSFEPCGELKESLDGSSYICIPPVEPYYGHKAETALLDELKHGITVYALDKLENGFCYISAYGAEPYFSAQFFFNFIKIEWDKYKKKAWYEEDPFKKSRDSN